MKGFLLRESSRGIDRISVQDRLLLDRTILFTDEVSPESADELITTLWALELEDPSSPIKLCLNSPGGEVTSGLAAYDAIMNLKCPVDTLCIGTAASMASILFLAGRERAMYEHTRIMIHDPLLSGLPQRSYERSCHMHKQSCRILAKDIFVSNDTHSTGLCNNDLIIGPSGSGKTGGYVIPNLLLSD